MNTRPEDTPKIIVLVVLIIGFLAYFFVRVMPMLTSSGSSSSNAPSSSGTTASTTGASDTSSGGGGTPVDSGSASPLEALEMDSGVPAPSTRDPFKPPVPVRPAPGVAVASAAPPKQRSESSGSMPFLPSFGGAFGPSTNAPKLQPAPVPAPPLPAIELKGVVPGDPAIAVVMIDGQTFYKQEGDRLAEGLSVAKITEAGIVMRHRNKNLILDVGHSLSKEPAAKPGGAAPLPEPPRTEKAPPVSEEPPSRSDRGTPPSGTDNAGGFSIAPVNEKTKPIARQKTTHSRYSKSAHARHRKVRRHAVVGRRPRSQPSAASEPTHFSGRRL